jgi:hypothetical protein
MWGLRVRNRAGGQMYLDLRDYLTPASYDQEIADLPENQWVTIETYFVAATTATGAIKVWQDGVLIFDVSGIITVNAHPHEFAPANMYARLNSADGGSPTSAILYADDCSISTQRLGV